MGKFGKKVYEVGSNIVEGAPKRIIFKFFPRLYKKLIGLRTNSFVKPGDWVVQAGVDLGVKGKFSNAILLSDRVKKNGKVFAIEPDPRNVIMLKEYISKHKITNIEVVEKAVWHKTDTMIFEQGEESWWNRLDIIKGDDTDTREFRFVGSVEVQADTIDNIIGESAKRISHVCLTVNGAEYNALQGMDKILKNDKLTVLIVNQKELMPDEGELTISQNIMKYVERFGFKTSVGSRWIVAEK